jgi:hypothetical protein
VIDAGGAQNEKHERGNEQDGLQHGEPLSKNPRAATLKKPRGVSAKRLAICEVLALREWLTK